ncbi:hypothetical protein [Candidatus Nitrotoga sp. M5]|uniref:hypothetical protein n=1 Tax=Candidatus Nitrotoga sp. M5 TaxID=2890409 RepID=UPI001EF19834|nr:hypothetical protein [Candidatus Nitrotoga sp. M5]
MRRFILSLMMCLLPLQISWAAVAEYCGHEQSKAVQHFGHHDDEHKASSAKPDPDKQPEKFNLGHDHCHMSVFLGLLNESAFRSPAPPTQPSLRSNEAVYPSITQNRPERPKWSGLA